MSACISHFFVLNPRGDRIVFKDYRNDVARDTDAIFMRHYRFYDSKEVIGSTGPDPPPFFNVDGVTYLYVKKSSLIFVLTTRHNGSPMLLAEFLQRVIGLITDCLGTINEDSMRKNFPMIYEILDEVIDWGYMQDSTTEGLKTLIFNEAIKVDAVVATKPSSWGLKKPWTSAHTLDASAAKSQSVLDKNKKNEVFVDIIEKVSAVLSGSSVSNASIEGCVAMRSCLPGNPLMRVSFNEDLAVGAGSYGTVRIDDCAFHECANYDDFDSEHMLKFNPPEGEFHLMNYRVSSSELQMPFFVEPIIENITPYKVEVILRIRSALDRSNPASGVNLTMPIPKSATSVTVELGQGAKGQRHEYDSQTKKVKWEIARFEGGIEHMAKVRITLNSPASPQIRRELGPFTMGFEVPNKNLTGLTIRNLSIEDRTGSLNHKRWVRNLTEADSYVCRIAM